MNRIMIIGICGAGKSTLANILKERTGLPVFHLDQMFWRPGWVESDKSDFYKRVEAAASGDRWIIDGNYSSSLEPRLARADTIIYLDFPRRIAIYRALLRVINPFEAIRLCIAFAAQEKSRRSWRNSSNVPFPAKSAGDSG